jgi:hypothetical protein
VTKAVNILHAIDPNLICAINPVPFWDSRASAAKPVRLPNTYYNSHRYYNGGSSSTCAAPPSNSAWLVHYWSGNFSEGKRLLYEQLELKGPGPLLRVGLEVNHDEVGINGYCVMPGGDSHGHLTFLKDMYDYCKMKGIGYFAHNLGPFGKTGNINKWGMLTADWKLFNAVGLHWAKNLPITTPPDPCSQYIQQIEDLKKRLDDAQAEATALANQLAALKAKIPTIIGDNNQLVSIIAKIQSELQAL